MISTITVILKITVQYNSYASGPRAAFFIHTQQKNAASILQQVLSVAPSTKIVAEIFTTSNKKMTLTRAQTIACISLLRDKDDYKDFRSSERLVWVKSWLEKRAEQGAYHNFFQEFLLDNAKSFKEFIRMDVCLFNSWLKDSIQKKHKTK